MSKDSQHPQGYHQWITVAPVCVGIEFAHCYSPEKSSIQILFKFPIVFYYIVYSTAIMIILLLCHSWMNMSFVLKLIDMMAFLTNPVVPAGGHSVCWTHLAAHLSKLGQQEASQDLDCQHINMVCTLQANLVVFFSRSRNISISRRCTVYWYHVTDSCFYLQAKHFSQSDIDGE